MTGLENFAGGKNLHFFKVVPDYVQKDKYKAGWSPLPKPTAWTWIRNALLLNHIWASPNLVWGAIALIFYLVFPYDLSSNGISAQGPLTWTFFNDRFPKFFAVTMGYNVFWHYTLYFLGWADRPFLPGRSYKWDKIFHNMFWNTSGIVIWVGFDNVFAFLWATGRLPYLSDQEAFSTPLGMAKFILGFILVPLWREGHFYFAHRLLHFKPLYAMVHSLHHRNQDIEPFAGLSMHPVEHLYYYACILPSLLPFASPFHFLWNGIHLLLSPGASHSGYEDHMQSDAFHYMHHRYFECNYAGFGAAALDVTFGTFVESFAEKEKPGVKMVEHGDEKSTLRKVPSWDFIFYLFASSACVAAWALAVTYPTVYLPFFAKYGLDAWSLSLLCGFGPVAVALPFYFSPGGTAVFDKKNAPVLHLGIGTLVCSVPVVLAAYKCF